MSINKIAFFYPSRVVGGAELLFARLGAFLQEKFGAKVLYVDYKDGFIRNNADFQCLEFIDYVDSQKTLLPDADILITPISNIARIGNYLDFQNPNTKLLFWTIHALNLLHVLPKGTKLQNLPSPLQKFVLNFFYRKRFGWMKRLLIGLNAKNACCFMDYENILYQNRLFDVNLGSNYLPIPCPMPKETANVNLIGENEINICVLGRLVREKVFPLINVLDNLLVYESDRKKIVHIIGDGDSKRLIDLNKYKNKIEIKFTGTIKEISELHNYLKNNVDIVFAMGTSVIEAAGMKLPAVVLPYSYNKIKNSRFMYFFENQNYTLGTNIDSYKKTATHEFGEILDEVYNLKNKENLGNDCYNYFIQHHSLDSVAKMLLEKAENDKITYKKYEEILNK